jgi:hypothetical protein
MDKARAIKLAKDSGIGRPMLRKHFGTNYATDNWKAQSSTGSSE